MNLAKHGTRTLLFGTFALFALGILWNRSQPRPPTLQFDCSSPAKVCSDAEKAQALQAACADPSKVDGQCRVTVACGEGSGAQLVSGTCSNCPGMDMTMSSSQDLAGADMTMTTGGGGLTLNDSGARFSTYTVPSVTCMNDPSYGNTVSAPLPQSIVTALGLTQSGTYTFMFYSGSFNNVLIIGPPSGTIYYKANVSGLTVATSGMSGTLPSVTMMGTSGATGNIIAGGDYTCP